MRKFIVVNIVFVLFFLGYSFANMKDNFFCTISPGSITVTLERQNNYKCSQYTKVLSQAINKEYKDVLEIQNIIKQWYDIEFWTSIRENKREKIKKMLIVKNQIEDAVMNFDDNLFWKIKEYLIFSSSPYQLKYKKLLKPLNYIENERNLSWSVRNMISLMQEQIQVIDNIIMSQDYDTLMKNFNRYVYLKKQIEWK